MPFPEEFDENDVRDSQMEADVLADTAFKLAFRQPEYTSSHGGRDPNTGEVMMDSIPETEFKEPGDWNPPKTVSRGWEKGGSEQLSEADTVNIECKVQDKTGRYWSGSIDVNVPGWRIPKP